ncbi:MAG: hypothetical protein JWM52_56 [Candidatus Saccharibacteria bacterium]|nr:hypothetical protein [Candidatus Saccharibacteria bacterium]
MEMPLSYFANRTRQLAEFVGRPNARESLETIQNPQRVLILRAILATPGLPAFLYQQIVAKPYKKIGYDVIGIGAHAVTVKDGPSRVKKIYPESIGISDEQKLALLAKWEARQALNITHIPQHTVEQQFSIEPFSLPPFNDDSVVTASQPIIEFDHTIMSTQLTRGRVTAAATQFVLDGQAMYEATRGAAVPDVIGNCNLVIDRLRNRVVLIDTIALMEDDPSDHRAYQQSAAIFAPDQDEI